MSDDGRRDDGPAAEPPLAPHLANRPDRPVGEREFEQGRSRARLILILLFVALPMVVLVVVVLNSLATGPPDQTADAGLQSGRNEVTRYCVYSVRDYDDYDDCLRTTQANTIRALDTNAGRYARGEITRCLADAGPRCTLR